MSVAAGTQIGHYEVISLLGAGGMGEVYLAKDTRLRRHVALKLLPSDLRLSKDRLLRFEQEAYAASALNHPNILTIYEIGQTNERHFIAAEYIDGVTLRLTRPLSRKLDIYIEYNFNRDDSNIRGYDYEQHITSDGLVWQF